MPIKGLTDRDPRFNQIGELRKGSPKEQNRPGEDLTYFRFTSDEPELESQFQEAYGQKPQELEVFLPYQTVDECFDAWFEQWGAGSLKRRCDGEEQVLWQENGEFVSADEDGVQPKPCLQDQGQCDCQKNARLQLWLPKLNRMGIVLLLTSSTHDIINLHGSLKRCEQIAGQVGRGVQGIPMTLKRVPKRVSTPSGQDGGRARREFWLLFIEPKQDWVKHQLEEARARQLQPVLTGEGPTPQLPGDQKQLPGDVDEETGEIVVHEKEPPSDLEQRSRQGEPDFQPSDIQALMDQEHASFIREAAIAASTFGFDHSLRPLRLSFTSLLVGHELETYKHLKEGEGEYVANALDFLSNHLQEEHDVLDADERISFAKWCVRNAGEYGQKLSDKRYLRPVANEWANG